MTIKSISRTVIFFLPALVFLSGCVHNETTVSLTEQEINAIRAVNEAYASGWNADDSEEAVLTLFTDDAVLLPHHGDPQVEGKKALRKHFWPAGLAGFKVNSYDFEIMEITGSADLAYSRGRYSISFSFEDEEGTLQTFNNAGNYLMIFRKSGDRWKISRYIWNDPPL